jgi:hypothetical protein
MIRRLPVACSAAMMFAMPALAQEKADEAKRWSHEGALELGYDHSSDVDLAEAVFEYAAAFQLTDRLIVQGALTAEPVEDPSDSESYFENEGAFIEELNVKYLGESVSFAAGKVTPVFGSAAVLAPGLRSMETGEAYELAEQLGVTVDANIAHALPELPGDHVVSAAVFTADRTVLSESIFTNRGRLELDAGGPGNTEDLSSFALSLDGANLGGWGYTLGFRRLAAGITEETDESAVVAGASYAFKPLPDYDVEIFGEAVSVTDADGVQGGKRTYHTLSATVMRGLWHSAAVVTGQNDNAVIGGADLSQVEVTAGRDLPHGLSLDAAIRFAEEGADSDTFLGARLTWNFE